MRRIAVLASGNGSNFAAVAEAAAAGRLEGAMVEVLVCDRPGARVIEHAERAGIPVELLARDPAASREELDERLLQTLAAWDVDGVVLAGWMRVLSASVVRAYLGSMINVHPSLLPAFPGLHAIRQALAAGVRVTGVTVHFVDDGVDTGPILAQAPVEVRLGDTEASLAARIHPVEHALLCGSIADLAAGRAAWRVDGVWRAEEVPTP